LATGDLFFGELMVGISFENNSGRNAGKLHRMVTGAGRRGVKIEVESHTHVLVIGFQNFNVTP
jgi:hypothetical protein